MSADKIRILFIVDIKGWAWGIIAETLSNYLPDRYECMVVARDDFLEQTEFDAEQWGLVMVYTYKNKRVLSRLDQRNTMVVIGSDPSTINQHSLQYIGKFRYFLALNGKVYHHLSNLLPSKKIYYVEDGTDVNQFKPPETPIERENGAFRVGWVGTADRPLKRFKLAELAVKCVDGAEFVPLKGIEDPNYVPHEHMHEYYHGIDCLLITSVYEVHSTVLYEAMACGVPCITTRTGDAEQFIIDGVNGYLLDYDADSNDIANHIKLLMHNPEKRVAVGEEARVTVVAKLSWERVTPRYINIFNKLIRRGGVVGKRKIGILWWASPLGSKLSVVALQYEALKRLGVKPTVFDIETVFDDKDALDKLNDSDLIFTGVLPAITNPRTRNLIEAPIMFQVDGYGATTFHDGYVNRSITCLGKMVDLVTFLDMNVYEEFRMAGYTPRPDEYLFIPNGCNRFPRGEPTFRNEGEVLVGTLLKENYFKKPWIYIDSAKHNMDYRYPFPVMGWHGFLAGTMREIGWRSRRWGKLLDFTHRDGSMDTERFNRDDPDDIVRVRYTGIPNVEFRQLIPYDMLSDYMESCDVFTHYSGGDAFAKTVTEAFSYGKAPLVSDMVRVQGISIENLPLVKSCIGDDISLSYHRTRNLYRTGDEQHLKIVPFNQPKNFARETRRYVEDQSAYQRLCEESRRWADEWITWDEKWENIFRVAEDRWIM